MAELDSQWIWDEQPWGEREEGTATIAESPAYGP